MYLYLNHQYDIYGTQQYALKARKYTVLYYNLRSLDVLPPFNSGNFAIAKLSLIIMVLTEILHLLY